MKVRLAVLTVFVVGLLLWLYTQRKPKENLLAEFDIASDGSWIIVPVTVGEGTHPFLLDTGNMTTAFDKSLQPLLGAYAGASILNESEIVLRYRWPKCRLGNMPMSMPPDESVLCVDYTYLRDISGQDVYGVLGMDWLQSTVFQVDFDAGKLRFFRSAPADAGDAVPILVENLKAFLPVTIGSLRDMQMPIDTGCDTSGLLLKEDFARLLQSSELRAIGSSGLSSYREAGRFRFGVAQALAIGNFEHRELVFSESDWGLLGLGVLSRYVITFDFPSENILLRKGERFDQPDGWDKSGLRFNRKDGRWIVESAEPGSPAEEAGLIANDEILALAGVPTKSLNQFQMRTAFFADGQQIVLSIRRGELEMQLPIRLREWHPARQAPTQVIP